MTITTKVNKTGSTSGGFLGHNWYRVKVTLSDLKISNSKLNVSSYELGGLVLSTTGYWNVKTIHFAMMLKFLIVVALDLVCFQEHYLEEAMIHMVLII